MELAYMERLSIIEHVLHSGQPLILKIPLRWTADISMHVEPWWRFALPWVLSSI